MINRFIGKYRSKIVSGDIIGEYHYGIDKIVIVKLDTPIGLITILDLPSERNTSDGLDGRLELED